MTLHACSRRLLSGIVVLVTAMLLSSCLNSGTPTMSTSKKDMMIKENPNAKHAYRIEMRVDNAPGPFALVEGVAHYDVLNYEDCGEINKVAGTISRIMTSPEIIWTRKGDGVYETVVHADRMLDEDYFGRGMCHWAMTGAGAVLRATGADGETRFVPDLSYEDIQRGQPVTWYFLLRNYPRVEMIDDYAEFGRRNVNEYRPELRDQTFTVTYTIRGD